MIFCIVILLVVIFTLKAVNYLRDENQRKPEPDQQNIIIDRIVNEKYGPTARWSFCDERDAFCVKNLKKGTYPILVNHNGIIAHTDVEIDIANDEPEEKRVIKEPKKEVDENQQEEIPQEEPFNALAWFQKPEIRDAVRLLKTSNHSEFLIPREFLPDRKYWEEIIAERLILGFKSVRIDKDGLLVVEE